MCISCSLNIGGVTFTAESLMGIQPWPWRVAAALSILPSFTNIYPTFTQHLPNRTWHGDGSPKWSLRPKVAEPQTAEAKTVEAAEARKDGFVSSDGDLFGWWDLFQVLWCVDIAVAIAVHSWFLNLVETEISEGERWERWERQTWWTRGLTAMESEESEESPRLIQQNQSCL